MNNGYSEKDSMVIEAKKQQTYNDFIQVICTEAFPQQLTIDKAYSGYLIKKHNDKDGIRIMLFNDQNLICDYPIRWFKSLC